jgi:hypothetical protein
MERFMNAVLNIIQEGTGTRCPLDTTCIHDSSCIEPRCELRGHELAPQNCGENLSVNQVFQRITEHNRRLGDEDRFSTEPLRLTFRSKNVQNMRFVDTPGIISNKSTGQDNREDIMRILSSEMSKPNTKLCVLLEPKEFATNPIVDFCDTSFDGRKNWIDKATFLMTKYDKQLEDSRSAGKANIFFKEFHENKCYPHLVITPTLAKENLPAEELYEKRKELLEGADSYEKKRFAAWRQGHDLFRQEYGEDKEEDLHEQVRKRIGFESAKKVMREIMLEDTVRRLPEVLASLRKDLDECEKEERTLKEMQKFNNPSELKLVVQKVLLAIEDKVLGYLNGDLESTMKFSEMLQSLEDEIDEEEESDWVSKDLNFYTEQEDAWRERISSFGGEYPKEVQADSKFLGGKQYQRAIEFFRIVMIEALPNPYELKDKVANCTGYLSGGLQREAWENAMVQITRVSIKDVSHPGINYLIKHVGNIFRRLFLVAMADIKQGDEMSSIFKLLPSAVERYLSLQFDSMLWSLMEAAAEKTHFSLEPMYSTVDPHLPTFYASRFDEEDDWEQVFVKDANGNFIPKPKTSEQAQEWFVSGLVRKMAALMSKSGNAAKSFLKAENSSRARKKQFFLPDERTAMLTADESEKILQRSFEYIVALMEFNLVILKFQLNHYLYEGFKKEIKSSFSRTLVHNADWDSMVEPDPEIQERLEELKEQIAGLRESLIEVQRIQRRV